MGLKKGDIIMNSYIGCKIINAVKSSYWNYFKEKYGAEKFDIFIKDHPDDREGYKIVYPPIGDEDKPYVSWSPKEVFEKAYRIIEDCEKELITK
jgi:hypothetical protein